MPRSFPLPRRMQANMVSRHRCCIQHLRNGGQNMAQDSLSPSPFSIPSFRIITAGGMWLDANALATSGLMTFVVEETGFFLWCDLARAGPL